MARGKGRILSTSIVGIVALPESISDGELNRNTTLPDVLIQAKFPDVIVPRRSAPPMPPTSIPAKGKLADAGDDSEPVMNGTTELAERGA